MYLKGTDMDVMTFPTHFNDLIYQIIKSLVWLSEFTSRGFPWEIQFEYILKVQIKRFHKSSLEL